MDLSDFFIRKYTLERNIVQSGDQPVPAKEAPAGLNDPEKAEGSEHGEEDAETAYHSTTDMPREKVEDSKV